MLRILFQLDEALDSFWNGRPPAPLPARRAYRPEGRAYASERGLIFSHFTGYGFLILINRLAVQSWIHLI